ncbi:diacylglycerol kinase family protein [Nocardia terpenica]|uniref:diacylglycerol kinase family protein n=1 Tax=Nocardia terpenica TaxID=455432 RepID=UPI0031834E87
MTDSTAPQPIRSVLLVTNPLSGHGRGLTAAAAAATRFTDRGVRVTEVRGGTAEESVRQVRAALAAADAPDAVVCAGGDGLVCITLGALAGSAVPLGLVPGGTGNDLARELGVPEHDPIAAADVVLDGRVRRVDLGTVESSTAPIRFATVVGTGFDARVTLRANRMRYPGDRCATPSPRWPRWRAGWPCRIGSNCPVCLGNRTVRWSRSRR